MTLAEFIAQTEITMVAEKRDRPDAPKNESTSDRAYRTTASHWTVTLRHKGAPVTTPYTMGSAHKGQPVLTDVLGSLQSDCQSIEGARSFEDWADDLGYDTDSRKAEVTYRACQDIAQSIRVWLGLSLYAQFLECTED